MKWIKLIGMNGIAVVDLFSIVGLNTCKEEHEFMKNPYLNITLSIRDSFSSGNYIYLEYKTIEEANEVADFIFKELDKLEQVSYAFAS